MLTPRQRAIIDVLGAALGADVTNARSDTPLSAYAWEPQDEIVLAAALDEAFPASVPHIRDAHLERSTTMGELMEYVEKALESDPKEG